MPKNRRRYRTMPWEQRWAFAVSILLGRYYAVSASWDHRDGVGEITLTANQEAMKAWDIR